MGKYRFSYIILVLLILILPSCDDDSFFHSKVSKSNGITTVTDIRAGGLERALNLSLLFVTHLVINDTIDSRDFKTMRDNMPNLSTIDLSNAVIAAYNGYEGTAGKRNYRYSANSIPEFAFYNPETSAGKKKLKTIIFPNSIHSIKEYAFNCCGLVGELNIPASVTDTIAKSAFGFCTELNSLSLSPVSFIGESAFQGCIKLGGNLVFPESLLTIQDWAFASCELIENIYLPASLTQIGVSAFNGCSGKFSVSVSNENFSAADGVLFNADKSSLYQCPKSKTGRYIVPETVISVSPWSFANCTGLTSVILPTATMFIEDNAFNGCSGLLGNFNISAGIISIGQMAFEGCSSLSGFSISTDNNLFSFTDGLLIDASQFSIKKCIVSKSGACIIDPGIMFIDNSAFANCSKITAITLPEGILDIGKRAFYNCYGLRDLYVKSPTALDLSNSLSAFEAVDKKLCVLHVPAGSKATYLQAAGWNEFQTIVEN